MNVSNTKIITMCGSYKFKSEMTKLAEKLPPSNSGTSHFLRSKKDKFGFGKLTVEPQNISSIGNAAREMLKHLEKCTSD